MKTVRLGLLGRRFDDQYTLDLQGYLSPQDFTSTICLFNEAARQHPPPGHKLIWVTTLLSIWTLAGGTIYICWIYLLLKDSPYVLLIIPTIVLLTSIVWIWRYRYMQRAFQCSLVELCSRVNATENIRGINYRLTMLGDDVLQPSHQREHNGGFFRHSSYALLIEFDDRYRALQHLHQPASTMVPMYYTPPPPVAAHHCQHQEKRYSMHHHPYEESNSVFYEKQ